MENPAEEHDSKYVLAAALVFVAKGDGRITGTESGAMVELLAEHFRIRRAEALELLTNAMEDMNDDAGFEKLARALAPHLGDEEKELVTVMMLKVVAADGDRDAEEMEKLRRAAELLEISADVVHRAYDRYFEETQA